MNNTLNLNQLQYLDALLKKICFLSGDCSKNLKMVIRIDGSLIAGDFMLYNSNLRPQIKEIDSGLYQQDLPVMPAESATDLLLPLCDFYTGPGKSTCIQAIDNQDVLLKLIFSNEAILKLIKEHPWNGTEKLCPYLYDPVFINEDIKTKLQFLVLDESQEYEVVSIISSDE